MAEKPFEYDLRQAPPRDITLEHARAAWVGPRYSAFAKAFQLFDERGRYAATFTWPVFFIGWWWFLYRKMYREAAALLGLGLAVEILALFMVGTEAAALVSRLIMSLAVTLSARWLYWKATDRNIEKALEATGGDRRLTLVWLEKRGGVNLWVVFLLALLLGLFTAYFLRLGFIGA